jgi:hypothetical protein
VYLDAARKARVMPPSARWIFAGLVLHALCAGAFVTQSPYETFQGRKLDLYAWEGKQVVFLTARADLDPKAMTRMIQVFDRVCEYYQDATGRSPAPNAQALRGGRIPIAQVDKTCGAGCGYLGTAGIEMQSEFFLVLYEGVRQRDEFDQALPYEFGRNFWFYGDRLEYRGRDDTGSITTGYAVFMRFMALAAARAEGGPFNGRSFPEFRKTLEAMVDTYTADKSLTWENTLRAGKGVDNPMALGCADLFASFLFRLRRDHGGDRFIKALWHEVPRRPRAQTTQDAVDNFVVSASLAAGRDLTAQFADWRWPLSAHAKAQIQMLLGSRAEPVENPAQKLYKEIDTRGKPATTRLWSASEGSAFALESGGYFAGYYNRDGSRRIRLGTPSDNYHANRSVCMLLVKRVGPSGPMQESYTDITCSGQLKTVLLETAPGGRGNLTASSWEMIVQEFSTRLLAGGPAPAEAARTSEDAAKKEAQKAGRKRLAGAAPPQGRVADRLERDRLCSNCCASVGGAWRYGSYSGKCSLQADCQAKWGCCVGAEYSRTAVCREADRFYVAPGDREWFRCLRSGTAEPEPQIR